MLSQAVIHEHDTTEDDMADKKVFYTLELTDALSTQSLVETQTKTQTEIADHITRNKWT